MIKERLVGATGSASGIASILGSWQVCHNVCLGLVALLGIMGITLTGMPLAFLTTIAIPLWSIALLLLIIVFILYKMKKCVSRNLLFVNTGLIIAGIPFLSLQPYQIFFWSAGGIVVVAGIVLFIRDKRKKTGKGCMHEKN